MQYKWFWPKNITPNRVVVDILVLPTRCLRWASTSDRDYSLCFHFPYYIIIWTEMSTPVQSPRGNLKMRLLPKCVLFLHMSQLSGNGEADQNQMNL